MTNHKIVSIIYADIKKGALNQEILALTQKNCKKGENDIIWQSGFVYLTLQQRATTKCKQILYKIVIF